MIFAYHLMEDMVKKLFNFTQKVLLNGGGWFPLVIFLTHLFVSRVLHLYDIWPSTDVPMHFLGGLSIAYFVSMLFQLLPRKNMDRNRVSLLELLLIGSMTASTTVFWEFAEFIFDQIFHTNIQINLANTMQDMAMGILGAAVLIVIRSQQLHVGLNDVKDILFTWFHGDVVESY